MNLSFAKVKTPVPSEFWQSLPDSERLVIAQQALASYSSSAKANIEITATRQDGQIIVAFIQPVGAGKRGAILLDLEEFLKSTIDRGLTVWLEPLGDRNSLRNLRGIEVKS